MVLTWSPHDVIVGVIMSGVKKGNVEVEEEIGLIDTSFNSQREPKKCRENEFPEVVGKLGKMNFLR